MILVVLVVVIMIITLIGFFVGTPMCIRRCLGPSDTTAHYNRGQNSKNYY